MRIGGEDKLINLYLNSCYTYDWVPGIFRSASWVFANKKGSCYEIGWMAIKMKRKVGENANLYWDTFKPRRPEDPPTIPYGHNVAASEKNDCMFIFIDWNTSKNKLHPPMDMKRFNNRYTIRHHY